jgi:tRNA U34 2-thiouridine synthase MnmA/TrmU
MLDNNGNPVTALVLLSGGLDSRLAVCVLKAQGISVTGLTFETPFFSADRGREAASQLGIPLIVEDYTEILLGIVEHPRHGFGSCINPCIDCHAAMLKQAGQRMERDGFQLVATGEVLNQRPMSQTRRSLTMVAEESGYKDWILRPLSAKLLPETEPERRGWVDRSRLLDLNGRSRKPQVRLAELYGLKDYPPSAGGCRLTEPNYAARLRDLRVHGQLRDRHAIQLLRVGRHFRLNEHVKVVIGRDAVENEAIEALARPEDVLFRFETIPGPTALVTGIPGEDDLRQAVTLCARYSDAAPCQMAEMLVKSAAGTIPMRGLRADEADVERLRIK